MNKFKLLLFILAMFSTAAYAQNSVSGTITDSETSEGLIGASVIISGTTTGAQTDASGKFSFTTDRDYPLKVEVSYTGYTSQTITVKDGNAISVSLTAGGIGIGEVVIQSVSRKAEKVQDAPASVSVLGTKQLATTAQPNPVRMLVNVPGVQIQQQSASRMNIEMRGASGLFGTSVFPIMDYRSLVGPGIGTFDGNIGSSIDLERIEIVRGPGSALYGPGVTAGVIHFITKNPIDHTGLTAQVAGGEGNTLIASTRYARANEAKTFGFKVNATFTRGDEFTLDPNDPDDAAQMAKFSRTISRPDVIDGVASGTSGTVLLNEADLDPDQDGNMMQDFYQLFNASTTLEFRPQDDMTINVSGGINSINSVFYNSQGEGLNQTFEYWAQARMQKGGLFAQLFYVDNNGGTDDRPTFLYQTGNTAGIGRKQLEGQVQYGFEVESFLNSSFVVGTDYRSAISNTENLVYGRNEDDDDYNLIGAYVQGKFKLGDKFDLVLAGRYDQFLFLDDGAFAPRAALVWKANPKHTFRASFNKASAPNSALTLNIDFPLANINPNGSYDIWLRGNKEALTFGETPTYSFAIPTPFDGQIPVGTPGVGIPLAIPFGATTSAVIAGFQAAEDAGQLNPGTTALLAGILTDPTNTPTGSVGQLTSGRNVFNNTPLDVIDAPQTDIRTENTWEVGYKGLLFDKLGVTLDVYNITAKNFTLFTAISPVYALVGTDDLATNLGTEVSTNVRPDIEAALINGGMDQATASATADALAAAVNGAYQNAGNGFVAAAGGLFPVWATAQTEQSPDNGANHITAGYRTFDEINYTGIDLGLNYYVNQDLSVYFNYSYVSQTEFMVNVVGSADGVAPLPYSLGVPANKFRAGVIYSPAKGWHGNLSFQHDPSFNADFGQFSGMTDVKNIFDLGVGHTFDNGLSLDIAATNLFNNEYRAFPNMPKIGRRALLKATYHFN
jgi:iron complex outermembrane receptor protein